jgi:hypothetical protein
LGNGGAWYCKKYKIDKMEAPGTIKTHLNFSHKFTKTAKFASFSLIFQLIATSKNQPSKPSKISPTDKKPEAKK